nr:cationic peroxidase 1-like [Ipomoea batatas]
MVALSGGHTIGKARCTTFRSRIYNDNNINAAFAKSLQANCPQSGGDNNLASLDTSPTSFDNAYFKDLQNQKGLLHSDQELFNGGSTDSVVNSYSSNPSTFSADFANAMLKMTPTLVMRTAIPSSLHINVAFILSCMLFSLLSGMSSAQLSATFYSKSCPNALSIIKSAVKSTVQSEARMGASLLRLHFHDCFVNGCDASILLDDTKNFTGEQTARPNNKSIRGLNVIDNIKAQLEKICPGIVSCADVVAVAARDSVVCGRRDSTTASLSAANNNIPGPNFTLSQLKSSFSNQGFSEREMVALSGGHTIGKARCTTFRSRIYNDNNINAAFAKSLQANCPQSGGDNNLASLDTTPTSFDNAYFKDLQSQKGLLHSDQELFNGGSADSVVNSYSSNPSTFSADFANAMLKMSNLNPLTGTSGQIRKNCGKTN